MSFNIFKEMKENHIRQKEIEHQKQIERVEKEKKIKYEYCIWYSNQTQKFVNTLKGNNFNPTWGFEVEENFNTQQGQGGGKHGRIYVFDIPKIEGIAFDVESQQMLYFSCPSGYYEVYKDINVEMQYKYYIVPFKEILDANVEIEYQTTISTITSKQNVVKRSIIGGVLAGDAGAIIGGTTGDNISISKSEILPKKILFNIKIQNDKHPIISFEFNNMYGASNNTISNKSLSDIMYGLFSGKNELATFFESEQTRNCNTYIDYHYCRLHGSPKYDKNNIEEYSPIIHNILPTSNLQTILDRINHYKIKIDSIIERYKHEQYVSNDAKDNLINGLASLIQMKENGFITDDEFLKLKKKLI